MRELKQLTQKWHLQLGAFYCEGRTTFTVWAPSHRSVYVLCEGKKFPLERSERGYFVSKDLEILPGTAYSYLFENGQIRPDPVSRALLEGVHGPSLVVDPQAYAWETSNWKGIPYNDVVFYELHVGTFSQSGTFEGVIERLPYLKDLGVTMIELMPLHSFPGRFNWGYDGVSLYAPFSGYGGYEGLKRLVDSAHGIGLGVCLDVVYNHLGPEGNYLSEFGPYFSGIYHTPWGKGLNFDGKQSDEVKRFVIDNALYWLSEFRIDALRIDAIHGIYDFSTIPMLGELAKEVQKLAQLEQREIHVIAENARNDSKTIRSSDEGGLGFQGMWNDDFHHALHSLVTGESQHYYADFTKPETLKKTLEVGLAYDGVYSPFFERTQGNSTEGIPLNRWIAFAQNHDQIGNRAKGERISMLVEDEILFLIPFFTILTPMTPLIFMGEEFGEKSPFEFFVDFSNQGLMRSIHQGRMREFQDPQMPYPSEESFERTHLRWDRQNKKLLKTYRALLELRRAYPADPNIERIEVGHEGKELFWWTYPLKESGKLGVFVALSSQITTTAPFQGEILFQEARSQASVHLLP